MIPIFDVDLQVDVPADATYWVPARDDVSEEGFGYFRDTWAILHGDAEWAAHVVEAEGQMLAIAAAYGANAADFEKVATAFETGEMEGLATDARKDKAHMASIEALADGQHLGGLELGVAGLVYTLSAAGFAPAASCRGHAENSWSDCPVVFVAASEPNISALAALASANRCGLYPDGSRGVPWVVYSNSVTHMHSLARVILSRLDKFFPFEWAQDAEEEMD